jgi:hypothetical protein
MKLIALAATAAMLVFGAAPAFAGGFACGTTDLDGDGVLDCEDNCSDDPNPAQDDTDGDDCGNVCDMDFTQDGIAGISDFTAFTSNFNTFNLVYDTTEPVTGPVGIGDFTHFTSNFNSVPGPSGTTTGTVACP